MTYIVSNDPAWWPFISSNHFSDFFVVAYATVVVYDWALTFAKEFKLIWRKRWSSMTILYVCVRYIGIINSLINIWNLPVPVADIGCIAIYFIWRWIPVVVNAMLGAIMMIRIHAMYGRSKKMLVFLVTLLLLSTIATIVVTAIASLGVSGGEAILSGYRICVLGSDLDTITLGDDLIIPTAIWEILTFLLTVWIVIKHFHERRQLQSGSTIGDCFTVLIRSHALYFLAFVIVACFTLGSLSPYMLYSYTLGAAVYIGILNIAQAFQMFVLGPRLILSVREYNASLVASTDAGTHMTSIAFQADGDVLTGGDV